MDRIEKIASKVASETPTWVAPEFMNQINITGTVLKKFTGRLSGTPIWALKGKGKIYKDTFGWISFDWSVNPMLENGVWSVKSELSFAPATSGSFANDKFREFIDTVPIHGNKGFGVFGISSKVLDVVPNMPERDINEIVRTHAEDLKNAKKFWKAQQVEFDTQHRSKFELTH